MKQLLTKPILAIAILSLIMMSAYAIVPSINAVQVGVPAYKISETRSGLVKYDSLTTGNTNYWTFGGDAIAEKAPYIYSEDSNGLHIGVQGAINGQWAGFYAVSPDTNAQLFHAIITLPYTSISDNSFDTGLYVQTSAPYINYVSCGAGVDKEGYWWAVVQTYGDSTHATKFNVLYFQWENNQPLTRDCTIITNGQNFLKVYLDGTLVYSNNTMNLKMPSPFNAYLEVQTSSSSAMRFSTYIDYYATLSGVVTVNNVPPASTVEIVGSNGNTLASAQTPFSCTSCQVNLDVGKYFFPLTNAYIQVYISGVQVATTSAIAIWGGDVYSLSLGP